MRRSSNTQLEKIEGNHSLARIAWRQRVLGSSVLALALLMLQGCKRHDFPDYPANYREYAYITNSGSNTVTALDMVNLRMDRVIQVGTQPSGIAANPVMNEVYAVNTGGPAGNGSVTAIDTETNRAVATIPVGRLPYFIEVDAEGKRAYVADSGSNDVSVIDLIRRKVVAVAGTGEQPGLARIAPDGHTLVVSNRGGNSVSIFDVSEGAVHPLRLRAVFEGCLGATDAVILPDSSKAFVACSSGQQVMAITLAAQPGSYAAQQDPGATKDRELALLDVGKTPVHLAMKPDGGEIFVSNFDGNSISEIATGTDEVGGTYIIGDKPVRSVVSADNSMLWISDFGGNSVGVYSIDDGKLMKNILVGSAPDALAFSAAGHLLLAVDSRSGDVAFIRTQERSAYQGRSLFNLLPSGTKPSAIVVKAFKLVKK